MRQYWFPQMQGGHVKGVSTTETWAMPFPLPWCVWVPPFNVTVFPSRYGQAAVVAYGLKQEAYAYDIHGTHWMRRKESKNIFDVWMQRARMHVDMTIRIFPRHVVEKVRDEKVVFPAFYEVSITYMNIEMAEVHSVQFMKLVVIGDWIKQYAVGLKPYKAFKVVTPISPKVSQILLINDSGRTRSCCAIFSDPHSPTAVKRHALPSSCWIASSGCTQNNNMEASISVKIEHDDLVHSKWIRKNTNPHIMRTLYWYSPPSRPLPV